MIDLKRNTVILFLTVIITSSLCNGVVAQMRKNKIILPKTSGVWTRPDSLQMIDSTNIFEYMNGAGELYLGYRFQHLEVYEYTSDHSNSILIELYFMETSDDAFGLLSLDWGGEPVFFDPSAENKAKHAIAPESRALYGGGLLRICSDNIYVRIMAYQETSESKAAVLALGRAITTNRTNTPEPALLNILPAAISSDWTLRNDRIGYFRSHLVLNSLYYLSHQNILNFDLSTEAVIAPFENVSDSENKKRVQFILVKYASAEYARQALNHFLEAYLPEYKNNFTADSAVQSSMFFKIEDGWLGYKLDAECVALIFECPGQETARIMINQIEFN